MTDASVLTPPHLLEDATMTEIDTNKSRRQAMIRAIRGMIGIKFPDLEHDRSVRIARALEFKLFTMCQNDWGSYSDLTTLHERLQAAVREYRGADGAAEGA